MSTMKQKTTMLSMIAMAMMGGDPAVRDMFLGTEREPAPQKNPNSPESQAKLAKAEAKRQRKAEKMKRDAIRTELGKETSKEGGK